MAESTRRGWLAGVATGTTGIALAGRPRAQAGESDVARSSTFRYSLNTSTIRGQKLSIVEEARIAAEAGYAGIEPWLRELEEHEKAGDSLDDLGKLLRDLGLSVIGAIGFAEWSVDDDERRRKGLEILKRDMEKVRKIGGTRIAAPPSGMTDRADADYLKLAGRYRAILEIGDREGVRPLLEVWGFSKAIHRLGQAALIAVESGHPDAAILADVYHLYKGGSDFGGFHVLRGVTLPVFHMNDYPANFPRDKITDADRVFPGDGVAPIKGLIRDLRAIGFDGWLSLELFNKEYYARDAREVARVGLEKMRGAVESSG